MNDLSGLKTLLEGAAAGNEPEEYTRLLARVKKALDAAREIRVPVNDIRPYLTQPREYFNRNEILQLSASIDASGQASAGLIRKKPANIAYMAVDTGEEVERRETAGQSDYELIDGERRWRAVWLIPKESRPDYKALLIEADDDVVQFIIAGITNFNRAGHTPLETMRTIEMYRGFELPMDKIAKLLGFSESWAEDIYDLRKLVPEVKALLNPKLSPKKRLPVTAAIKISKQDPRLHLALANRVMDGSVKTDRLRGEIVRLGQQAGIKVPVYKQSPSHQWEIIKNAARMSSESAKHLRDDLMSEDKSALVTRMRCQFQEIEPLKVQLQETIKAATQTLAFLSGMPPHKK